MSNQPKALELASVAEHVTTNEYWGTDTWIEDAAALLRLQHEVIGELVEALEECESWLSDAAPFRLSKESAAALAKAKELEGEKE